MKKYLIPGGLLVVAFVTAAVYWPLSPTEKEVASSATQVHNSKPNETVPADLTVGSANAARPDLSQNLIDATAVMLLERYGDSIDSKRTQARLLEERQKLAEKYPDFGLDLFQQAVAVAFPELEHEILQIVAKMAAYREWLESSYLSLQEMSLLEREGRLWAKRQQLFGADAEIIWANERAARADKEQAMQAELKQLDQADEITLDEAVFQLESSITEIYGHGLERQVISPGVLAGTLFSFEAVQEELEALPAEERQEEINRLRKKLGFSDEEVESLAARDRQRQQRWENGKAYMTERQALAQQYTGEPLKQELDSLRRQYFENSAKTIELEESDGFFRFNRPRVYGRN